MCLKKEGGGWESLPCSFFFSFKKLSKASSGNFTPLLPCIYECWWVWKASRKKQKQKLCMRSWDKAGLQLQRSFAKIIIIFSPTASLKVSLKGELKRSGWGVDFPFRQKVGKCSCLTAFCFFLCAPFEVLAPCSNTDRELSLGNMRAEPQTDGLYLATMHFCFSELVLTATEWQPTEGGKWVGVFPVSRMLCTSVKSYSRNRVSPGRFMWALNQHLILNPTLRTEKLGRDHIAS